MQAFPFLMPALGVAAGDSKSPVGFGLDFELVAHPATVWVAGLRLTAQAEDYAFAVRLPYSPALSEFQ